jgi:hypothetical protein
VLQNVPVKGLKIVKLESKTSVNIRKTNYWKLVAFRVSRTALALFVYTIVSFSEEEIPRGLNSGW